MSVIYLQHPVHGSKVATLDLEAAYDEQHGWARYNPNDQNEPQIDVAPTLRRARRKAETPDEGE